MAKEVPIVFVRVGDPVGSGFVASLAHPGGNITGFAGYDGTMGGKWLEVLKETTPELGSVLTIYQPETPVHLGLWYSIRDSAPRLGIEAIPVRSTMRPKSNASFRPTRRGRKAALLSFRMPTSVTTSSSAGRCSIGYPCFAPTPVLSGLAGSSPTLTTWQTRSGEWPNTLIEFFAVRSRAIFLCSNPSNSISSSTSRPLAQSA
jgi:hypothetical protein